eukprot:6455769-Amphidinium_carterae.1
MASTSESVRRWIAHVGCTSVCDAAVQATVQRHVQTSERPLATKVLWQKIQHLMHANWLCTCRLVKGWFSLDSQLIAFEIFVDDVKLAAASKSHGFDAMGLAPL